MKDNVIRFPSSYEPDPNDPNNKHLHDALNPTETDVSVMHPVELWVDREFLIAEVELSLATIRENALKQTQNDAQRTYLAAMIQQRVEFLEYLNCQRAERVYVALYPAGDVPQLRLGEDDDDGGTATAEDPFGFREDDDVLGDFDDDDLPL